MAGKTARNKKTTAAKKGLELVSDPLSGVVTIRGISTAEGIMEALRLLTTEEVAEWEAKIQAGLPLKAAPAKFRAMCIRQEEQACDWEGIRALVLISEMSALLKKAKKESSRDVIEKIMELYDCPDQIDHPTKVLPFTVFKPYLTILATTTLGKLEKWLAQEDVEGGFANRFTYFIGEAAQPLPIPLEPDRNLINVLINDVLKPIRRKYRHTRISLDPGAEQIWRRWYTEWWTRAGANELVEQVISRLPDHVMKLAMIYAVTEHCDRIYDDHMAAAIAVGDYWEHALNVVFAEFGLSKAARIEQRIIKLLEEERRTKRQLRQALGGHYCTTEEFNRALEALLRAGIVRIKGGKFFELVPLE